MEVLVELKDYIQVVLPEISNANDWSLMAKCIERIKPLGLATDAIQSDSATLLTVARCGNTLHAVHHNPHLFTGT